MPILSRFLIHPSDSWPLPVHTEGVKLELPPRLFSLREYGWRVTSGRSDPYFHGSRAESALLVIRRPERGHRHHRTEMGVTL